LTIPNIELLNYIFYQRIAEIKKQGYNFGQADQIYMFPQTWPNTGGGFAEPGYCYGQTMTSEYTTVLIDSEENMAMVCFGEKPAYIVSLSQCFMDDVKAHRVKGKHEAKKYY